MKKIICFILVVIYLLPLINTNHIIKAESEDLSSVLEINSAEEFYALSRILASNDIKNNHINKSPSYDISNDFAFFNYPEDVTSSTAKINYLSAASYILKSDIAIEFNISDDESFFLGIGSSAYPFKGSFDGNGKTVTLSANSNLSLNSYCDSGIGLFGSINNANIINLNIKIEDEIIVTETEKTLNLGAIVGYGTYSKLTDCTVTLENSKLGADYSKNEEKAAISYVSAVCGFGNKCMFTNCVVNMQDSLLFAKTINLDTSAMYSMFSVGSILGFSNPGSDNTNAIGTLGNQLYNCKLYSQNSTQQDIIAAYVESGDELTVGGLIGCTFNNFLAKNCSVNIKRGNIIAKKSGDDDSSSTYGTQAGGIIGRLEHTGELNNCSVEGDYLNIISISPNNQSSAGGITGIDIGPIHRDIITLNSCKFNGNSTSNIKVEITTGGYQRGKIIGVGGIVGYGRYKIIGCEAKNVNIINQSADVQNRTYSGEIVGFYDDEYCPWASGTYFTPGTPEVQYNSGGISFIKSDNVRLTLHNNTDNHIYENLCSTVCIDCGNIRIPSHFYNNEEDLTCNECDFSRKPSAPELKYKFSGEICLKESFGLEYSLDGKNWQDSPLFTNLKGNTEYSFYQRVKATETHLTSEISDKLSVYLKGNTSSNIPAPIVFSFTDTVVTLLKFDNYEYSADGINWQKSNVFSNLTPVTEYSFYQRIPETEISEASHISPAKKLTTDKSLQEKIPDAPTLQAFTHESITLNKVDGCEYSLNCIDWQESNIFEGLLPATEYNFYQRLAETSTTHPGNPSKSLCIKTDKISGLSANIPVLQRKTSSSVTLVPIEGYEYSMDTINWSSSNEFTGLAEGTNYFFYQRIAETDTQYASKISEPIKVRTLNIVNSENSSADVNCDGFIDALDLAELRKLLITDKTPFRTTDIGDVNCDGKVNICDLVHLKRYFI